MSADAEFLSNAPSSGVVGEPSGGGSAGSAGGGGVAISLSDLVSSRPRLFVF